MLTREAIEIRIAARVAQLRLLAAWTFVASVHRNDAVSGVGGMPAATGAPSRRGLSTLGSACPSAR
jgi:hypothetical protein